MNHESCRERLVDLAYRELSRREAAEVEGHLAECETCRAERDRLAETLGAMRRLETPPAPERGDALLMAAARKAAEERRRDSFAWALRGFGIRIAAGTAFAALAVFLLVQVRQGLRPPTEDVARGRVAATGERPPAAPSPAVAPVEAPPAVATPPAKPDAREDARAKIEPMRVEPVPAPAERKWAKKKGESAPRRERRDAEAPAFAAAPPPPEPADRGAPGGAGPTAASPDVAAQGEATTRLRAPGAAAEAESTRAAPAPSASAAPADASRSKAAAKPDARAPSEGRIEAAPAAPGPSRSRQVVRAGEPVGSWAREIERRHAAGELSEAQKRFEPCPGGDVRRTAWIDAEQRVLKLVRERADGAVVEEWFDESGRLREATIRAPVAGGTWSRRVTVGDRGDESSQDASDTGLAPGSPPPALVRRDPTQAFFSGPGCSR